MMVIVLAVLALAACGSDQSDRGDVGSPSLPTPRAAPTSAPTAPSAPSAPSTSEPDVAANDGVTGRLWYVHVVVLEGDMAIPQPPGAPATIRFDADGTFSGEAGCNTYSGRYEGGAPAGQISLGEIAITEMGCLDAEDWFELLDVLRVVDTIELDDEFVTLAGPDGSSVLLGRSEPTPPPETGDPGPPSSPAIDPVFIGLSEADAAAVADERGVEFRVASRDGESLALTTDYLPNRVNVDLVDGVVVGGWLG